MSRRSLVDAGLLLVLCTAALSGLGPTYDGNGYLVVGVIGVLLGIGVVTVSTALRWPAAAPLLMGVVVFYVLGGPLCLRADGALAPTPNTWGLLTDQLIFGWKDLLTTLPPVDGGGPLLVLPWVLGLTAGIGGSLAARVRWGPRWFHATLPLAVPLLLLASVILLGVRTPSAPWLQGAIVAAVGLSWLVIRFADQGTTATGSGRLSRVVAGAGVLCLAGALAAPVGTWAAGGERGDADRVVLRTYVEPPFDVGQYPSPLSSFRRYVKMPEPEAVNLYGEVLFTLQGAPVGSRLRIATLDNYDGVVWGAANNAFAGVSNDTFVRVGPTLDNPTTGSPVDVDVTLGQGYSSVWLPTIGALQTVSFETREDLFTDTFRYNLQSSTGVLPPGLEPGDSYRFTAIVPPSEVTADSQPADDIAATGGGDSVDALAFAGAAVAAWSEGATDPMARVFAVADHLRTKGKYSDGVVGAEKIYRPGHYASRLDADFVNAPVIVGNDEQYAATMALLARAAGVPARVVLGAVVPDGGVVRGRDVSAWVELRVADGSWRVLPTETFMDTDKPADQQAETQEQLTGVVVPPPAQVPPPSAADEQTDAEITARKAKKIDGEDEDGATVASRLWAVLVYVGSPLLGILLVVGAILAAKLLRRHRRRSAGPASHRIVGAWRELVDHARDLGQPVPTRQVTRSAQSAVISSTDARELARQADIGVFGRTAPTAREAENYWTSVEAERRTLSAQVGRSQRWRAALRLRTFWR